MMHNIDREMLELAAKAAGIFGVWEEHSYFFDISTSGIYVDGASFLWNPLSDDGDALRLEVALKTTVAWDQTRCGWSVGAIVNDEFKWLAFHNDRKRASTMAAAKIGRQMQEGGAK